MNGVPWSVKWTHSVEPGQLEINEKRFSFENMKSFQCCCKEKQELFWAPFSLFNAKKHTEDGKMGKSRFNQQSKKSPLKLPLNNICRFCKRIFLHAILGRSILAVFKPINLPPGFWVWRLIKKSASGKGGIFQKRGRIFFHLKYFREFCL